MNDDYDEDIKEVNISDIRDHEDLIEEVNEYQYDSKQEVPEIQGKIHVKQNLQLEGDHSISMSKETDENGKSDSHPADASHEYGSSQLAKSGSIGRGSSENEYKFEQYIDHDENSLHRKGEFNSTTKIVQIDCQSLDPLETTKSKDELVDAIRKEIKDTGKEPDTKSRFYRVGKLLGRGAFGKVSLGMHKITNQLVAIKSINKEFLEEERSRRKVAKEVSILKKLQHPNIINLYETFETEKHFLLVTELCPGGDLLNYVRRRRKLTEDVAKYFFKQLVEACIYCHKKGVVHRDIKLDNILLDQKGFLKLGDFGVSRAISRGEILRDQCGTPAYIAPEVLLNEGYNGKKSDTWS
jgi:tRNA A-37 threonylcarbamoyl transferase component Bud32